MRRFIFTFCLINLFTNIYSQFEWPHYQLFTVYNSQKDSINKFSYFTYVESGDLDNDGKEDIIATAKREFGFKSILMWYKNLGDLKFSAPKIIYNELGDSSDGFIDVGDIDNDSDLDLTFISSEIENRVMWFENITNGDVFKKHIITDMLYPNCNKLTDVDKDGDLDVLAAGTRHAELFENINGSFFFKKRFYEYFDGSHHFISGEDYDGDNDIDILYWRANYGPYGTDDSYLHYNLDGKFNFSNQILLTEDDPQEILDIEIIDLNDDGENDIVYSCACDPSGSGGQIFWRAVVNGIIQEKKYVLDSKLKSAKFLNKYDIDLDGDLDLISAAGGRASGSDGEYLIYRNLGKGNFLSYYIPQSSSGWLTNSNVVDLDGDGKPEIVGSCTTGVFGVKLEIVTNTSMVYEDLKNVEFGPNPVDEILNLYFKEPYTDYILECYDALGTLQFKYENINSVDFSWIKGGTYFLILKDKFSHKISVKKVIKL